MVPCYVLNFPEYHLLILENIAWEIYPTIRRARTHQVESSCGALDLTDIS